MLTMFYCTNYQNNDTQVVPIGDIAAVPKHNIIPRTAGEVRIYYVYMSISNYYSYPNMFMMYCDTVDSIIKCE